jgi:hypothetical protein
LSSSLHDDSYSLQDIALHIGICIPEQWCDLTAGDIKTNKELWALVKRYGGSIIKTLYDIYPEYEWKPWKFRHFSVPHGYWDNLDNQKKYFNWLSNILGINKTSDWYSISRNDVISRGGATLLNKYGDSVIRYEYPSYRI